MDETATAAKARKYEQLGWAVALIAGGLAAAVGDDGGDLWLAAAAAGMAFYVVAGWMMKFRVSLGLVFVTGALVVLAMSRWSPWEFEVVPTLLIVAGVVLAAKALRGKS